MENLKKILKQKLNSAKKIAVLCVGSELRADDGAGLLVADELKKIKNSKLKVFFGSTAPENFTGEIIKYKPSHIIIVDCVDIDVKPGSVVIIPPDEVSGVSFSTHMLPVKMMIDYLFASLQCEIIIIGIQPKTLVFGEAITTEVKKSALQISDTIGQIMQEEF